MAKKVSIEAGHGGADAGAVCGNICEKNINLVVALEFDRQLRRHGVDTLISRTSDVNDPASAFLPKAQTFKPDVHISVHTNAFNGTAKGFEIYRNTNGFKMQSDTLCKTVEAEVKALGQSSRGVKDSPFIMSGLQCPTAYCELGFLDNPDDYKNFDTAAKQQKFGTAYAKAILKFLGVAWKDETGGTNAQPSATPPSQGTLPASGDVVFRVIAGSYSVKTNAETHIEELRKKGVEAFIAAYKL